MKRFRALAAATMLLTLVVVTLGAYVRLKDAGLGCPDWPGCYGEAVGIPTAAEAEAFDPDSPLDREKAWIEVIHRYVAGVLGLLIFGLAYIGWRSREEIGMRRAATATALAVLVVFQALLGMLTVTERLMPSTVTSHLLGGMLILALAASLVASDRGEFPRPPSRALKALAAAALVAAFAQVALGGWVSTNYAGLSCPGFPGCGQAFAPAADYAGFRLDRGLGETAAGEPITHAALATIHWVHRIGALALAALVAAYVALLLRESPRRGPGVGLALVLTAQVLIGVGAVRYGLPLSLAWLHNLFAAILIVNLAALGTKILALGKQRG